ncbi:S41 family peptidase [bacterium]|nr:MAG: S41 family peptidase [bacterium]
MKTKNFLAKYIGIILLLAVCFSGGFLWGNVRQVNALLPSDLIVRNIDFNADLSILWDVLKIIKTKYKGRKDLNDQDLVYGAAKGLVKSLGDPYSEFMAPESSKKFLEDISGSFEGIGAEIGIKDGILTVVAPLEGTPAKKAGLMSGDKIIKIDDETTPELSIEKAITLIRGPRGTEVILTILRGDNNEQREITIKRGIIKIPVIEWSLKGNGDIAYIQLFSFTENSPDKFSQIAQEILQSPANKIILDLRGNPGGYLESAVEIAGWFLADGELVVKEDEGNEKGELYKSKGKAVFGEWPTVILIDEGSASASEILAGALRDNLGTKLIGKNSFGKGTVQQMEPLKKAASLKITIADWITPSGLSISKSGLSPDVEVDLDIDAFKQGEDSQLQKAIENLTNS